MTVLHEINAKIADYIWHPCYGVFSKAINLIRGTSLTYVVGLNLIILEVGILSLWSVDYERNEEG